MGRLLLPRGRQDEVARSARGASATTSNMSAARRRQAASQPRGWRRQGKAPRSARGATTTSSNFVRRSPAASCVTPARVASARPGARRLPSARGSVRPPVWSAPSRTQSTPSSQDYFISTNHSAITCAGILYRMEKGAITFAAFLKRMEAILCYDVPAGHVGPSIVTPYLSNQSKRFIFRLIRLLLNELEKRCFVSITSEHILVNHESEEPYLEPSVQVADQKTTTHQLAISNIHDMARIIDKLIRSQRRAEHRAGEEFMPREVQHLLDLMLLKDPWPMLTPIRYHSSLVPMENRGYMFLALQQFLMDVVRYTDHKGFEYILRGIDPPEIDWVANVCSRNIYLADFYRRGREKGSYDSSKPESTPKLHPLDLSRNVHSHPYEGSASRMWLHGMRFTRIDMNHALYLEFETQLASLSVALHSLGYLEQLKIEALFPY